MARAQSHKLHSNCRSFRFFSDDIMDISRYMINKKNIIKYIEYIEISRFDYTCAEVIVQVLLALQEFVDAFYIVCRSVLKY